MIRLFLLPALVLFFLADASGQTPDFMFALEGTYIGHKEIPDVNAGGGRRLEDARLDGKRNGAENGFVLEWMLADPTSNNLVTEHLETWHWDAATERLVITRIVDNKPIAEPWFIEEQTSSRAVLARGGEYNNAPALLRLTLERLPGQIRFELRTNDGSGKWTGVHRYLLDDYSEEND